MARKGLGRGNAQSGLDAMKSTLEKLYMAQLISAAGDVLTDIAVTAWVVQVTGQVVPAIVLLALKVCGTILVGLLGGGVLIDRLPKRLLMVCSDIGRAVLVFSLVFLDRKSYWLVYPTIAAMSILSALFHPAREYMLQALLVKPSGGSASTQQARRRIAKLQFWMIARIQGMLSLVNLIGPAAAGLLVSFVHIQIAFLLDAASFLISAGMLLKGVSEFKPQASATPVSYLQEFLNGFAYVWGNKDWVRITLLRIPLAAGLSAYQATLYAVLLVQSRSIAAQYPLLTFPVLLGLVGSVQALGIFFGTRWITTFEIYKMAGRWGSIIASSALLLSVGIVLLVLRLLPFMLVGGFLVGLGMVVARTAIIAWGQAVTAPHYMGRAMAIGDMASRLSTALMALCAGALIEVLSESRAQHTAWLAVALFGLAIGYGWHIAWATEKLATR